MVLGRERREGRRAERAAFGLRGSADRYQMREKLLSIGDDFWIADESGRRVFKVDGKALRLRQTLIIEDASGKPLVRIQDRPLRLREVMEIEDASGASIATVSSTRTVMLRR